jgi:aryl-alcohol dehydrogenase-like predicted oxidoreductase
MLLDQGKIRAAGVSNYSLNLTAWCAGARNEAQVKENAGAADVELSVKEVAMVSAKLKTLNAQLDVT